MIPPCSLTVQKAALLSRLQSVYVDDINMAGKTENMKPTWKILMKDVNLGERTSFPEYVFGLRMRD